MAKDNAIGERREESMNASCVEVASAATRGHENANPEIMDRDSGIKRRPPGVRAQTGGKRRRIGATTQAMFYPTAAIKEVIVQGARIAQKSMSTFCQISAVKETAVLLGRSIDDLGIPAADLRRLRLEEAQAQNTPPPANTSSGFSCLQEDAMVQGYSTVEVMRGFRGVAESNGIHNIRSSSVKSRRSPAILAFPTSPRG